MSWLHLEASILEAFDELGPAERGAALDHAQECAECRARLIEGDPARVFAFLGASSIPPAAMDRLTAAIDAELDRVSLDRAPGRRAWVWGPVAASLLLAALIGGYLVSQPEWGPTLPPRPGPTLQASEQIETGGLPSVIEVLSPADAQVYDLSVGETQIVMIFDQGLDI